MRPDKAFAKLNAGTTYREGRSSPGVDSIRWQDVAGACQGLDEIAWLVALYLWANDQMAGSRLLVQAEAMARGLGFEGETARKMACVAMIEMKDLACALCRGAGEVQVSEHRREVCPACQGHARRAMSEHKRARWVGIPRSTWRANYAGTYEDFLGQFVAAKHRAVNHVHARLGTDD